MLLEVHAEELLRGGLRGLYQSPRRPVREVHLPVRRSERAAQQGDLRAEHPQVERCTAALDVSTSQSPGDAFRIRTGVL